jgi:hypothetical protein
VAICSALLSRIFAIVRSDAPACLFVLALLAPHAARAQLTAAEVACAAPHDPELVARVTGQTRDLPLRLRWVELGLDPHPTAAQMARAAREQQVQLVVAIRGNASVGQTVYVYDAEHDALRTRRVAPSKRDRMSRSAAAETVALIVRGELSAALADRRAEAERAASTAAISGVSGGTTGSGGGSAPSTSSAAASATHAPPPQPATAARKQTEARPAEREARSEPTEVEPEPTPSQLTAANPFAGLFDGPLTLALAAGMRTALPVADHVLWSPSLAVQLRLAHLGFELHGSTSFTAHLAQDSVRIALRRHAFGAALFANWRVGDDIDVALGPAIDLAFMQRTTVATGDDLMKTVDHTPATVTLAALADVRWRFLPRVGVSARIGLDFPLHPLLFAYGAKRELARESSVAPWALARLFVDIWE